jgi:hypothetical protein
VGSRVLQQVSGALREVADAKVDMRREVDRLCDKLQHKVDQDELQAVKVSAVSSSDWRMALGEVSINLRRELADKAGRSVAGACTIHPTPHRPVCVLLTSSRL